MKNKIKASFYDEVYSHFLFSFNYENIVYFLCNSSRNLHVTQIVKYIVICDAFFGFKLYSFCFKMCHFN